MIQRAYNRKTAYNWRAYADRRSALLLLREERILVDTVLETEDGYLDYVHWQVIKALCPSLVEACKDSKKAVDKSSRRRRLVLPKEIDGQLARKLVDCAYGQRVIFSSQTSTSLSDFYNLVNKYRIAYSIQVCLNFAQTLLEVHNCIQLFLLSLKHRHHALRRASYSMIRLHFKPTLFVNPDFHLLHKDHLQRLLMDNCLRLDEDEELVWVAIVKWMLQHPKPPDLCAMYNRMIGQQQQPPGLPGGINFSQPHNLNLYDQSKRRAQLQMLPELNHLEHHQKRKHQDLCDLIKCLRFMRFKSLSSFYVILSSELIQRDEQLVQLVEYMKLRYILRKKIPVDKRLLKQLLPEGRLEKIKNSETARPKRIIKSASKFIQCRQLLHNQFQNRLELIALDQDLKARKTIEPLKEEVLEAVDRDWLERSKEPRVPSSIALLIGGWRDGSVTNAMMAYDFVCDKWFKLNIRLPEPRAFHASCSSPKSGHIFIMGGTDGKQILSSVLTFDPNNDVIPVRNKKETTSKKKLSYRFRSLCPMSDRRCHLSAVFHTDGRLYALGGHNGLQRLRSGEWFDHDSNQWHPIAEMTIARSDASACSHENKIFIAGGQIGDQYIQASVEFYKPNDNTWTFAAPMIVPRMSFKLVSYRSHLLAIGGTNGLIGGDEVGSVTRSVERYNSQLASWSLCAPMAQKRSSFGAIQVGSNLIVVGGHGCHHRLKTSESLNIGQISATHNLRSVQSPVAPPTTLVNRQPLTAFGEQASSIYPPRSAMRWTRRASLPTKQSGFSIAVVDQLKNSKDFSYHGAKTNSIVIKQKTYCHRFKIIKKRKLIKHLKIALVVTVVILIM